MTKTDKNDNISRVGKIIVLEAFMLEYIQQTIIGFTIVMISMAVLTLILILISSLTKMTNKKIVEEKTENNLVLRIEKEEEDDKELIAVISAAINEYARSQNKNLRIVSFKRASDKAPAWNKTSRTYF